MHVSENLKTHVLCKDCCLAKLNLRANLSWRAFCGSDNLFFLFDFKIWFVKEKWEINVMRKVEKKMKRKVNDNFF
jgi:hypothetical protein